MNTYLRCLTPLIILAIATSLSAQTTFYHAKYSIDDVLAQDQYYQVDVDGDSITVIERGVFLSNPDIYAFAAAKMDTHGYSSVEIAFDNGSIQTKVEVKRSFKNGNMFYYSYLNDSPVDTIEVSDSTIYLFDGPNPTFDVLNARFIGNNKATSVTLGLINWINGTFSEEEAYYTVGRNEFSAHKTSTNRISFSFFEEGEILPLRCYQNGETYTMSEIDSLPMPLRR